MSAEPKSGYHHGDLARALVEVALEHVSAHGAEAFKLAHATRALGVSHAAAYRHFANRRELLDAVARRGMEQFATTLATCWSPEQDPEAQCLAMGRAVVRFARATPRLYLYVMGPGRSDDADTLAQAAPTSAIARLVERIEAWQQAGWIRAEPPMEQALLFWAAAHGVAHLAITGRLTLSDAESDALCDRMMQALHSGLTQAR
ncbi:MAG: TetR/AcrR family transcriptional regulator [Myxococcales bacterium]|nr:TetR/AcrR family transcriptional regulator [Myxococcales bacterium]